MRAIQPGLRRRGVALMTTVLGWWWWLWWWGREEKKIIIAVTVGRRGPACRDGSEVAGSWIGPGTLRLLQLRPLVAPTRREEMRPFRLFFRCPSFLLPRPPLALTGAGGGSVFDLDFHSPALRACVASAPAAKRNNLLGRVLLRVSHTVIHHTF